MKKLLFILFMTSPLMGSGPKYNFDNPHLNDEFENVYKDIGSGTDFLAVHPFAKATILGMTPKRTGLLYFCSDCATDAICVSTGTALGAFSRVSARTTACQ